MGRVKTRLGQEIGAVKAWAFYCRCLIDTARRMAYDNRWRTWLALTPDASKAPRGLPSRISMIDQGDGDLGTRMNNAMVDMPPGPTVIIGTDIPDIQPSDIAGAFNALGANDAVLGPAQDGGYWLVGCRRRPRFPGLFDHVRWSSEHALADTLANADRAGLRTKLLANREDVDDEASYKRWRNNMRREFGSA